MPAIELMVRFNILFLFLFLSLSAQRFPNPTVDSLLTNGIQFILLEDYNSAEKNFQSLNQQFPDLPLGNIFLAAVNISKATDYNFELNEDKLDLLFENAEEITENYKDKYGENLWYHYFVALVNGYKSYYSIEQKDYLSGMFDGIESIKSFENCLEIDKNFAEAFVIIGNYLYWKSKKTEFLEWFPFIEDNTDQGIKFLERAVEETTYSRKLAVYTLIWVYINEKRFQDAVNLSRKILDQYPNNRFVKRALASAYYYLDKEKSIEILNQIKSSLVEDNALNGRNKIILNYRVAKLYFELKNYKKAGDICSKLLSDYAQTKTSDDVIIKRIEMTKELSEKIKENL
ncbi:MAG: tetratricopeptide repeat protein [Melioribacteraceae bacterium]|nr:tetratricopeptide repeat protein [Melioribacteraceae bacterium]